jgi:hypothetical protein
VPEESFTINQLLKGDILKDCMGYQRFNVEMIKKVEHYGLGEALVNWQKIHEELNVKFMLDGCEKRKCNKSPRNLRKNGRKCNYKYHLNNRECFK